MFTEPQWAVIIILAASLLSITVLLRLPEIPEYGVSVVWALIAIFVKLGPSSGIAWLAAGCAFVLAMLTLRQFLQLRQ